MVAYTNALYPNPPNIEIKGLQGDLYATYIFAPILGGLFAGLFQKYINEILLFKAEKARIQSLKKNFDYGQG